MHLTRAVKDGIAESGILFGSNDWQLFESGGGVSPGAPVYIYASISSEPARPFMVSWQATFVRYVRHEEMHSSDEQRRPTSTQETDEPWGGYWEVRDLHRL